MNDRYVLGEGYAVGRGIFNNGPHKGSFGWVGLGATPTDTVAKPLDPIPLTFPHTSKVEGGKVLRPDTRRKFRLVLEVVEEAPVQFDPPLNPD